MFRPPIVVALALAPACASTETAAPSAPVEARSLLGRDLVRPALAPERRTELEDELDLALDEFEARPGSEEATIWVGRRLAYLGRFGEAVDWYSRGLEHYPTSFRLLRHRGHRYLTLRRIDDAIADLERAARYAMGVPDELEPDGAPNALGIPRSTNQSNIWYHLGLAHYVSGDFERALGAYRSCLDYSRVNDDMLVATSVWLYATLRRLERDDEARALLADVHEDMDVIENEGYHELLLLFAGQREADALLADLDPGGVEFATRAYAIGNWLACKGREAEALELFERVVEGDTWPAFGHLAAEAELARRRSEP